MYNKKKQRAMIIAYLVIDDFHMIFNSFSNKIIKCFCCNLFNKILKARIYEVTFKVKSTYFYS